jgi:membrane associated rhomboid family serine protease
MKQPSDDPGTMFLRRTIHWRLLVFGILGAVMSGTLFMEGLSTVVVAGLLIAAVGCLAAAWALWPSKPGTVEPALARSLRKVGAKETLKTEDKP